MQWLSSFIFLVGVVMTPFLVLMGFYAFLMHRSFKEGQLPLRWREALWLSVTDILRWMYVIERPAPGVEGLSKVPVNSTGRASRSR